MNGNDGSDSGTQADTMPLSADSRRTYFRFDPELDVEDIVKIAGIAHESGQRMLMVDPGLSIEEIKGRLATHGPSYFMDQVRFQEDISPLASPKTAERFIAERLSLLAPANELIVTDPFLFTSSRAKDADEYSDVVARVLNPLLTRASILRVIVSQKNSADAVALLVKEKLNQKNPFLGIEVTYSEDFHDRFWIADRERGIIMGTSLNKIGGKIFFVDALSNGDIRAVLKEVDSIIAV
ncbi:hypothetical protein KIV56_00940 [Cryobacterium breve]|uniref:Uncharacterized protein n=1 Tax=Cryobacterium breve TaxID=1259258 RepID=A0ABY7NDU5_9MICO|nr:hypothetical protein [Cryobacterium breve]WBM80187.1 hypothetical protein KIV56_00940 [Cryobacterium breve]